MDSKAHGLRSRTVWRRCIRHALQSGVHCFISTRHVFSIHTVGFSVGAVVVDSKAHGLRSRTGVVVLHQACPAIRAALLYFHQAWVFQHPHCFVFSGRRGRNATQAEDGLHQYSTIRIRKRISFQQVPVQVSDNKNFIQISVRNILIVSFQTTKNRDSGCFGSD